jgi:hypothetical protein
MNFSFRDLNLRDIEVSGPSLTPGSHIAKVAKATVEKTRKGGFQVVVIFKEITTGAMISDYINVAVPSSEEATNIGRSRLKALLTYGGHPSPDKPGDITSLVGLTVGIKVNEEEYEKDGVKKKGVKLLRSGAYFDPRQAGGSDAPEGRFAVSSHRNNASELDDDLPF